MNADTLASQPAPPSRQATEENFPVGSWLIPADARPTVMAFYRFARAADDIADDPSLDAATKVRLLAAMDSALVGGEAHPDHPAADHARRLGALFAEKGLAIENPRRLLVAFRADAQNRPCRTWSDLLAYCRFSAEPVGRFLLDLHGQGRPAFTSSDALCTALQILNHLQDCQADYQRLRRVYIPGNWLTENGLTADALLEARTTPRLRAVFDRMLDGVDRLNEAARPLPGLITNRGLRMEAAAIAIIARRLATRLRRGDPLAGRVALSKAEKLGALLIGAVQGWRA